MSKLKYLIGGPSESEENKEYITVQAIIKDVRLYVNDLGWMTLTFTFEGNNHYRWMIYHLNESPYQEILLWFLKKGADLGGLDEEFVINGDTISFDGGKTWSSIYQLCDDMKTLPFFKGQSVTLKCEKFKEKQVYLGDGAVSFDDGQTWFDVDARKDELDGKWYENGGRIGIVVL